LPIVVATLILIALVRRSRRLATKTLEPPAGDPIAQLDAIIVEMEEHLETAREAVASAEGDEAVTLGAALQTLEKKVAGAREKREVLTVRYSGAQRLRAITAELREIRVELNTKSPDAERTKKLHDRQVLLRAESEAVTLESRDARDPRAG
jgi:hypothetical protein